MVRLMQFSITTKDITESTNDDAWELARQGAPTGTVVAARKQRAGRGQWGRVWMSPEGGLYFSLIMRPNTPERQWPAYSRLFAEAVASVLREECGVSDKEIRVKSPNDVICDQGKLCGISLESRSGVIVVGVGVNVFHSDRPILTDGRNEPAYVCDVAEDYIAPSYRAIDELLQRILNAFAVVVEAPLK